MEEDIIDFFDELDIFFFVWEGIFYEEFFIYLDEVFEFLLEVVLKDWEKVLE